MKELTRQIILYIFSAFGISNTMEFKGLSLIDKRFRLAKKLNFTNEDKEFSKPIYGCSSKIDLKSLNVLYSNISAEGDEHIMYISLEDSGKYMLYLNTSDENSMILSLINDTWQNCDLQTKALFLASMEYIRNFVPVWTICENYENDYKNLSKFIKYLEDLDEGSQS